VRGKAWKPNHTSNNLEYLLVGWAVRASNQVRVAAASLALASGILDSSIAADRWKQQ
jgi:hypothetical protein